MIVYYSLFRNGKELSDSDYFKVEVTEDFASEFFHFIETEIWSRFMNRHIVNGGIITDKISFLSDAISCGYHIEEVSK